MTCALLDGVLYHHLLGWNLNILFNYVQLPYTYLCTDTINKWDEWIILLEITAGALKNLFYPDIYTINVSPSQGVFGWLIRSAPQKWRSMIWNPQTICTHFLNYSIGWLNFMGICTFKNSCEMMLYILNSFKLLYKKVSGWWSNRKPPMGSHL